MAINNHHFIFWTKKNTKPHKFFITKKFPEIFYMKIEAIYHSKNDRRKECKDDPTIKKYSKEAEYHPFLLEREYVRSLNATKLDRLFSKPFLGALTHAGEGICYLVKDCELPFFATASYDNQATLWDMSSKTRIQTKTFDKPISAVALDNNQNVYVNQYKSVIGGGCEFKAGYVVTNIDFVSGLSCDLAVASTNCIQVFDINRITLKIKYDVYDTTRVKFNSSFKHIMGVVSPTKIELFDNRSCKSFASIEQFGTTCMDFNIQQGYVLAAGNEDGNGYSYDIRNLEIPVGIFRGHVNAVVSIAFNPNGKEIVTGSFDRTIRLFDVKSRKSRDCYYNDRMQIVHGVTYSNDGKYVISGSDDGCLRLWKAQASKKIGPISKQEIEANKYKDALKEKYKDVGDVSRISKHRFLPKELKQLGKQKHEMFEAQQRREARKKIQEEEES